MTNPMTRSEARDYAPQWGSYINAGDPGACMYGLDSKGRPADAFNRDLMVAHIDDYCLPIAEPDNVPLLESLKAYLTGFTFPEPFTFAEPAQVKGHDVAEFVRHHNIAMLWATTDESDDAGGDPLDSNYDESDIHPDAMAAIESDCRAFLEAVGEHINASNYTGRRDCDVLDMAGHDFFLTRAGHGAGFWDGDWATDAGAGVGPLTAAAKAAGTLDAYVGDDGRIHV
jgi:hypothetical protein